jgi:hypothetical protein
MTINLAHVQIQGVNVAIFAASPQSDSNSARAEVLASLTSKARAAGLKVEKSALVFSRSGQTQIWGTPDLVNYLSNQGIPSWNHSITV